MQEQGDGGIYSIVMVGEEPSGLILQAYLSREMIQVPMGIIIL